MRPLSLVGASLVLLTGLTAPLANASANNLNFCLSSLNDEMMVFYARDGKLNCDETLEIALQSSDSEEALSTTVSMTGPASKPRVSPFISSDVVIPEYLKGAPEHRVKTYIRDRITQMTAEYHRALENVERLRPIVERVKRKRERDFQSHVMKLEPETKLQIERLRHALGKVDFDSTFISQLLGVHIQVPKPLFIATQSLRPITGLGIVDHDGTEIKDLYLKEFKVFQNFPVYARDIQIQNIKIDWVIPISLSFGLRWQWGWETADYSHGLEVALFGTVAGFWGRVQYDTESSVRIMNLDIGEIKVRGHERPHRLLTYSVGLMALYALEEHASGLQVTLGAYAQADFNEDGEHSGFQLGFGVAVSFGATSSRSRRKKSKLRDQALEDILLAHGII